MVSEATACKIVKSARRYNKTNQRNKKISIAVDKEGKYNIITITEVTFNLKTGNVNVSSALKYHGIAIYPQKFGKRNCRDHKYREKLDIKKKKTSMKHKDRKTEYNKNYYIQNKERMSIQRRQKRVEKRNESYRRGRDKMKKGLVNLAQGTPEQLTKLKSFLLESQVKFTEKHLKTHAAAVVFAIEQAEKVPGLEKRVQELEEQLKEKGVG